MKMLCRRVKQVRCLIFCSFMILFIYFYNNSSDSSARISQHPKRRVIVKRSGNDIKRKTNYYEDFLLEYSIYNSMDQNLRTFEDDVFLSSEYEVEPQNYEVINKIQYVDYVLEKDTTKFGLTHEDSDVISLKHLLSVCIDAAEAGGIQLRSVRRNFDLRQIWGEKSFSGSDNPVSVGSRRSNKAIEYALKNSFPKIQVVSRAHNGFKIRPYEEHFQIQISSEDVLVPLRNVLIWVDPLDAQREYEDNYLEYVSTMVCVAISGEPVIGVIHQPFENFTKWGWVGNGYSSAPYPVVSEPSDVSKPFTVIVSTSQAHEMKLEARTARSQMDVIGANGAGYKILQVAEGRVDAYFHLAHIKKWNTCAGDALIHAMNGKVTTFDDEMIDYGDPSRVTVEKGLVASLSDIELEFEISHFETESDS